jgi:hypothetical protein
MSVVLTSRQQEVLRHIQSDPMRTLQSVADEIGVTRERVRQITVKLAKVGAMEDRHALKERAKQEQETEQHANRERRKYMWRRMMFVSRRQVARFMARIDHHGMVRGYHMPGQETVCQHKDCTRPANVRGFCVTHYCALRANGALWVRRSGRSICKEEKCFYSVYARNLCRHHYNMFREKNPINSILPHHNKSGYRGVCWDNTWKRWSANIRRPGDKQEHLGTFDSKEMAARAYDTAARKYLGERAKLNFPDEHIEVVKKRREKVGISGYQGIEWHGNKRRWIVRISKEGKQIYVGQFPDLEQAARMQDSAKRYYLGDSATLNFPSEDPAPYSTPRERPTPSHSSQYRGVSWDKSKSKWAAAISAQGRNISIGRFTSEETAARAYDAAARKYHGEEAFQNFPGEMVEVRKDPRSNKTSQYRGVSWNKNKKKWDVSIRVNGKTVFRACFASESDAAHAYDIAARQCLGDKAILNFPDANP